MEPLGALARAVGLVALARAVGDKLYEMAIERGISFAESEVSLVHNVQSEIDKLRRTADRIHALLADADERRYIEDDSVRLWLRHLNDVAFDADDVLDDFQTDLNASKLRSNSASRNKRKRPWYHLLTVTDPILLKRRRIAGKISDIRDSLDAIHKDREQLHLRDGDGRRRIRSCDYTALPNAGAIQDVMRVRGRERDVDRIVELLTHDDGLNAVAVVPVVGMGGIGKTTVAKLVFDDGRIRAHFELRIWVCLSKDSDETAATREIIEAITKKKSEDLSLDILQHRLVDLVREKRFLLVLDNVWSELPRFWETVRQPLLGGKGGSKVLVTTRSEKAANAMNRGPQVCLQGLEFKFCLELFQERAFAGGQSEKDELVRIGEKIVKRCQGSPLAAKSLGALLYNVADEDAWASVLDEMWALEEEELDVLRTLKVSYDHLPLHLKRCLGYCSIFPSGYEFDKDELVKLWMAEDFVKPRGGRRRLETIGKKYFDDLLWRSFFQISDSCGQSEQKYTMPSLINELAQSVSIYECLRMEHNAHNTGSRNPRYASIFCRNLDSEVIDELCGYESLRTLIFHGGHGLPLKQVLPKLFTRFRCLRTLDLRNSEVEELPSSIGNLKHLRCLVLYNTHIRRLPESVSSLYNLQTLDLGECYRLLELPSGTGDLVNLRHLDLHVDWARATDLVSMPPGIGGLTSLQTLSRFTVTSRRGCGIAELKDLNLGGELCISKLENIVSVRDAEEANLKGKPYIEALMLRWSPRSGTQNRGVDEEVIGKLCPNRRLKKLQIEYYNGMNFPNWIGDPSFANLESLILSCCKRCRSLPPLEQLSKLRKLCMEGMFELESMPHLPPALEELEIRNCRKLTSFPVLDCLSHLVVVGGSEEILGWIAGINSLMSLTVSSIQGLKDLPGSFFQHLNSLKKLKIEQCNNLESVAKRECLRSLASLESLEISSCPELTSLPWRMHILSTLCSLEIRDAPKLTSMPVEGLPGGLQNLVISGCPLLQQQCSRDGGADWPKIQDIPNLNVG